MAEFVHARAGLARDGQWALYRAIGVAQGGRLIGGVVFHDYHPLGSDIEVTAAFDTPAWCSPASLRALLFYPLHTLGLQRCTARVAESNRRARRFLTGLGFREEGRLRRAFDGRQDMLVYGVLREELRFKGKH